MSGGLDLTRLRARALLLRSTEPADLGCRTGKQRTVEMDGKFVRLTDLGYYCRHGRWPQVTPVPMCTTPGCVMHLEVDPDEQDLQLVADSAPVRSLADMFRYGRGRGWFKGSRGYAQ